MQPNIEKKDSPESWRNREAATFAFSSILEGPSYASLAGVVNAGLDFLLNATKDPNPMVRQTTAWTIGVLPLLVLLVLSGLCLTRPLCPLNSGAVPGNVCSMCVPFRLACVVVKLNVKSYQDGVFSSFVCLFRSDP